MEELKRKYMKMVRIAKDLTELECDNTEITEKLKEIKQELDKNIKERQPNPKSAYFKKYVETHKQTLREKYICNICGGRYMRTNKVLHIRAKKHQNALLLEKLRAEAM